MNHSPASAFYETHLHSILRTAEFAKTLLLWMLLHTVLNENDWGGKWGYFWAYILCLKKKNLTIISQNNLVVVFKQD